MTQKYPNIITKIIIWLVVEILLNLLNLDTLADYTEYITAQKQSYLFTISLLSQANNTNFKRTWKIFPS
jgi:hypothetical protein